MTSHRAINWLLAAITAILLAATCNLDAPSDHNVEMAQAEDLQDAIKNEAAQARFTRAAAQLCGNAEWTQDADGAVHCQVRKLRTRSSNATQVAQVQP